MAAFPQLVHTAGYATYVHILTWFFDSPSMLCPSSIQRVAVVEKELGKGEGRWGVVWTEYRRRRTIKYVNVANRFCVYSDIPFRKFAQSFSDAVAADGQIFQTDLYSASHPRTQPPHPRQLSRWGERSVVVLIGLRLGIRRQPDLLRDNKGV